MLETKIFEIRDRNTFIPVIAVQMQPNTMYCSNHGVPNSNELTRYLLRRSGYSYDFPCVLLTRAQGGEAHYDCYDWHGCRTMTTAHDYIRRNWQHLQSGAVIDVEKILKEHDEEAKSEWYEDNLK